MPEALRRELVEPAPVQPRLGRTPAVAGGTFKSGSEDLELVVRALPPLARLSLRLRAEDARRIGSAAGLPLDRPVNSFERSGGRSLLRLGPDEWLLRDEAGNSLALGRTAAADLGSGFYVLTDVSHRNTGFAVGGLRAADMLNAGCALDLSQTAFPEGTACRTLLGKSEVLLLRTGPDRFEVECWRSFAVYVFGFLQEAARGV